MQPPADVAAIPIMIHAIAASICCTHGQGTARRTRRRELPTVLAFVSIFSRNALKQSVLREVKVLAFRRRRHRAAGIGMAAGSGWRREREPGRVARVHGARVSHHWHDGRSDCRDQSHLRPFTSDGHGVEGGAKAWPQPGEGKDLAAAVAGGYPGQALSCRVSDREPDCHVQPDENNKEHDVFPVWQSRTHWNDQ
jgi:hypothetical protein